MTLKVRIKLHEIMGKRRLNQSDVSRMTGISIQSIGKIFHEKVKELKFETLEKLGEGLNCNISDLLEFEEVPEKKSIVKKDKK